MKAHRAKQLSQSKPIYTELELTLRFIEEAARAGRYSIIIAISDDDLFEVLNGLSDLGYNYQIYAGDYVYEIYWHD